LECLRFARGIRCGGQELVVGAVVRERDRPVGFVRYRDLIPPVVVRGRLGRVAAVGVEPVRHLLVWKDGRLSRRILRTSATWWALPAALTAYTAYVLSTEAAVASYQSERIMVPASGLAHEILRSLVHVLRQHYWTGFHRGASQMGRLPSPTQRSRSPQAWRSASCCGASNGPVPLLRGDPPHGATASSWPLP